MAVVTWNVSKDANIAQRVSDGVNFGAGTGETLHIGLASGYKYRALLAFSYSFTEMVSISSAILHIETAVGPFGADPDINIHRLLASFSEGTQSSLSTSNAVTYGNAPTASASNFATLDVDTTPSTFVEVDITAMVQDALAAGVFYGVRITAADETASSDETAFFSREHGSAFDAYIVVTYDPDVAPDAPTGLSPTGGAVTTTTPTFSGTFSDANSGDTLSGIQIIVNSDTGVGSGGHGTVGVWWDSGTLTASGTSFSKVYSGPALAGNQGYNWKARTKDRSGLWGPYSAVQHFTPNTTPNAPTITLSESPTSDIKTLTPHFNITHSDPDVLETGTGYHIIVETSAGVSVWDSGDVSVSDFTTTSIVYGGTALSWQTAYRWRARTKDSNGAWGAYSGNATFTTHTAGVPISLNPTGSAVSSSIAPTFVGSRATSADTLTDAQIQLYASNGTTLIWDSASFSSGVTGSGFSKVYGGTTLSLSTTYKWRARITSSVGGVSAWSALQTFVTPSAGDPILDAPVGSGITPVTNLNFDISSSVSFNRHQINLYSDAAGTVLVTSDAPATYGSTTTKTFTYSGTLDWNTTYYWKARISSNGGSTWSAYSGLVAFTTDAAGISTQVAPGNNAWLGAPFVIDEYDDITSVTNGTSASTSLETSVFQTGIGSLKIALSGLASSGSSFSYRTVSLDLSDYGELTPFYIYSRISSLTNVSTVRLRFEFATSSDFADFDIQPSVINTWEQKSLALVTPTATGGTVDWSDVNKIGVRVVATGGGSVTANVYVDDLKIDATDPSFDGDAGADTVDTFRIRVYAADQTTLIWDTGEVSGSGSTFSKLYDGSTLTKGVIYYWQARYTKSTGPVGDYSALRPFTINADPSVATGLIPAAGDTVADTTTPHFFAQYNDLDKTTLGDAPTYMEVEVYRNSDSVLVYRLITKTSLSAATNEIYDGLSGTVKVTGAASPIVYETTYKYRVRYYDAKGARGSWTSYTTFKPSQAPTVTISSPSDGGTVASPSFAITWSVTSPGGKGQNSYRVRVIRTSDAFTVLDTEQVFSSAVTYTVPIGYLVNGEQYDLEVTTWDSDGLQATPDVNTVTADWTAPDAIQNFTVADDISISAMILQWQVSNLDPSDFREYVIYRRVAGGEWAVLTTITNQSTTTWYDYTAANTIFYEYKITQLQIVPGDVDLESGDSDIGSGAIDTDSWYVIGNDRSGEHIFELPVVSAPFTEPVQQEIFEPLGTSRKVIIRGRAMGAEGTLNLEWDTSERDTALAQIAFMKNNAGPHVLKSPFGDSWEVQFSAPNKDYQMGGHIKISISWTEIA